MGERIFERCDDLCLVRSGFFKSFYIQSRWHGCAYHRVNVIVSRADVEKHFGKRAHVWSRTPRVLVGRDGLSEAREFVFLNGDFGQNLGSIARHAGSAVFVWIHFSADANRPLAKQEKYKTREDAFHRVSLWHNSLTSCNLLL